VLTLPFELRARLAYDREISGAVCRAFVDSVLGFYRRRLGARGIVGGRSGTVTAVQTTENKGHRLTIRVRVPGCLLYIPTAGPRHWARP